MKLSLSNLLTSGFSFTPEEEYLKTQYRYLNIIILFSFFALFVSFFTLYHLEGITLVIVNAFTFALTFVAFGVLRTKKSNYRLGATLYLIAPSVITLASLLVDKNLFALTTIPLIPMIAVMFFLGVRVGASLGLFYFGVLIYLVQIREGFGYEALVGTFSAMVVLVIFFSFYEQMQQQRRRVLEDFNDLLNQRVKEEIEKNHRKEEELIRKSRMAQLGEMFSIIAHQWKQPLNIISTEISAQEMAYMLENHTDEAQRKTHQSILKQIEFMSDTMTDFRHFFNPNKAKSEVNLIEVIDMSLNLLKGSLDECGVEVVKEIALPTPVLTYKNELIQVLLNLIKNAKEEFAKEQDRKIITIRGFEDEQNATIEVIDNAGGIPNEILPKIFDQYFTTKDEASGTGLGLDLCYTIITNHCNGHIEVSNENEGAKFIITLPKGDA
jgi:signal transduction histidine kinase